MKRGAGGAGSSPSSGKDRWADVDFSTPPKGSERARRSEDRDLSFARRRQKDRGSDDEEENRGRGATGGTNDDDAGSESTPGKKVGLGRTKSQDTATKARNHAKYNLERYDLKGASFKIFRDFLVYDQEQSKGVKQVEDIAVCKLYNTTNKDCYFGGGSDLEGNPHMQEAVRQVNAYRGTRRTIKNLDGTSSISPTMKEHQCPLTFYRDEMKSGDSHFPGVTELARRAPPCTPSTGPVERLFSVTGQVESGKKYRFRDVSLAMLCGKRGTLCKKAHKPCLEPGVYMTMLHAILCRLCDEVCTPQERALTTLMIMGSCPRMESALRMVS